MNSHNAYHNTEFDSFIGKFYHLWRAGTTVNLNLECHAGEAWVTLRAHLGHPPEQKHRNAHPQPPHRSPSYQRRQARRQASRATEKATHAAAET